MPTATAAATSRQKETTPSSKGREPVTPSWVGRVPQLKPGQYADGLPTVKARLWRARQQLRKLLTKYFGKQKACPMATVKPGPKTVHFDLGTDSSVSGENQFSLRTQARDLIRAAQFAVQGLESAGRSGEDRTRAAAGHRG